jgi:23S rRNA pseudouridine1911/1915/1917 synthase
MSLSETETDFFSPDSEELFEHHRIVADPGQQPLRIDKFLMDRLPNTTRTKLQQASKSGYILVNANSVKPNYKVKPGDVITVELPHPVRVIELIPEDIPLNVVYEDDYLVVVNKQPGLVVHPGYGNYTGTLVNGLIYHFEHLPNATQSEVPRPGLVHRLDKNTSGIMVVGKTEQALSDLSLQFYERTTDRRYVALVWGDVEKDGTVVGNVGRSLKDRKVMTVFPDGLLGKHAVTHYRVLERFGYVTLVECKLETGRTHQIRVHMKHIGHPLFNDPEYGGDKIVKGTMFSKYKAFVENAFDLCPRQALHAKSLAFNHPHTGERMSFDSDIPADIEAVVNKWRNYVGTIGPRSQSSSAAD